MKSRFFNTFPVNQRFKDRIRKLAEADSATLEIIKEWLAGLRKPPRIDSSTVSWFSEKAKVSAEDSNDYLHVSWFFIYALAKYEDSAQDLESDLVESQILSQEQSAAISGLLAFVADRAEELHRYQRIDDATNAALPTLRSVSTAVSLRQVTSRDFDYDEQSIKDYAPESIGHAVVAEMAVVVTDVAGEEKSLAWQVTEESLDRFISDLLALQKRVECAKKDLTKIDG